MSPKRPQSSPLTRRALLGTGVTAIAGGVASTLRAPVANAAPLNIRYATGGGIGPNEINTCVWLDYLRENVLKHYGKAYTLDITYTRGSPEAAQLLAAGQVELGTLASPAFATTIAKNAIPDGIGIVADVYQDGHPGFATNTFFVVKDSPIKTVADLKGLLGRIRLGPTRSRSWLRPTNSSTNTRTFFVPSWRTTSSVLIGITILLTGRRPSKSSPTS
jgi:TRAP-type uncharacterized transport system substrate-binding protein